MEDKLLAAVEAIGGATEQANRWEEERRRRADEEERRRNEAEQFRALREEHEVWEAALNDGAAQWEQHQALRAYLVALQQHPEVSQEFVQWAHGYLVAAGPRQKMPEGEIPAWSHADRVRHGRLDCRASRW